MKMQRRCWKTDWLFLLSLLLVTGVYSVAGRNKVLKTQPKVKYNLDGCKYYKKGQVGVCDLATNTQIRTAYLKKGGNHCPLSRNITEACNTLKCKYKFAGWGSCNKADNTRVRLFRLRDGQPEACPTEKRKFRPCKSTRRSKVDCRYKKGSWSECDPLTQLKSRSLTLKRGNRECLKVKMVMKKCKPSQGDLPKKNGISIIESQLNDTSESVFNLKLPSPPEKPDIETSDITDTTVRLTWRPGVQPNNTKLLGYIIEYFSISGMENVWVTVSNDVEENIFTVHNLQPGTTYMFQVRAKNVLGVSQPSPPSDTIRTHNKVYSAPSRPKDMRLQPSSKSVVVHWVPPPARELVEEYILSYGRGLPDTYTTVLEKHQVSYLIKGLEPNTEYVVKLKAVNKIGEGQPIYDAVKTLKEWSRNHVLMPPMGLQISAQSDSSVIVSWSDSNQEAGVDLPDNYIYMVRYKQETNDYSYLNTSQKSVQIHKLQPFTNYEVSVRIVDRKDTSAWSMPTSTRTYETAPSSPPTDLTLLMDKPGSIAVYWQPPLKANGIITGYTVLYTTDPDEPDSRWTATRVGGEDLFTRITRIKHKQTYYFKVLARNRNGYGPVSNVVAFTTSAAAPGTAPSDVTVVLSETSPNSVHISWQPPKTPNGIITGYLIYYSTDATQPDRDWILQGVVGDTLSTIVGDLTPCTMFYFKMQARNKEGFGPLSPVSAIKTRGIGDVVCSVKMDGLKELLPPVGLKTRRVTADSLILSWKDIQGSAGRVVKYVTRFKKMKPSLALHYENITSHDTSVIVSGLDANTDYELSVRKEVKSVKSSWSMALIVRTKETAPGGPPEDITITTVSDNHPGTVTVTWQPPVKTNGLITGYIVLYTATKDVANHEWVRQEVEGDQLSLVLKGLTPDTRYYVRVQARNKKGAGPMSRIVTYVVTRTHCSESGCSPESNSCSNNNCPGGMTCVTMTTKDARHICMCSNGKTREDCTARNKNK